MSNIATSDAQHRLSLPPVPKRRKSNFFRDWLRALSDSNKRARNVVYSYDFESQESTSLFPDNQVFEREHVEFATTSSYVGGWDVVDMSGTGIYKMPHGVRYAGGMKNGCFNGIGVLNYPMGCNLIGNWTESGGSLMNKNGKRMYLFKDILAFNEMNWSYCVMPDRRFLIEQTEGLRPACSSFLTQKVPAPLIPAGCYDAGDGIYNPKTRCVTSTRTGNVIRIPTKSDAEWIVKNCPRFEPLPVGFRPEYYENWFQPEESRYTSGTSGSVSVPWLYQYQHSGDSNITNILSFGFFLGTRDSKHTLNTDQLDSDQSTINDSSRGYVTRTGSSVGSHFLWQNPRPREVSEMIDDPRRYSESDC